MKQKDILIVARPDHSLQIYNELLSQEDLSFDYVTFKCVKPWLRRIFSRSKKIVCLGKNSRISILMTIINIIKFKSRISLLRNISEVNKLNPLVRCILRGNKYRLVHYWPLYCHSLIEKNFKENDIIAIADVYFPNPQYLDNMVSELYQRYSLSYTNSIFKEILSTDYMVLKNAPAVLVPSEYVAETYKHTFPDKKFYVLGYGITISPNYKKLYRSRVYRFVYAGGAVSIEKGCDVLCDFFKSNPELEIHMYGNIPEHQSQIFSPYMKFSNIHFHGHIPKASLQDEISKYDVGIHLSRFDAYSLSVGEMVGVGLPVIVSNTTGISGDVIKYKWGMKTTLCYDDLCQTIASMTDIKTYSSYLDSIDNYITNNPKTYSQRMVDFYKSLLENKD